MKHGILSEGEVLRTSGHCDEGETQTRRKRAEGELSQGERESNRT